MGNRDRNRTQRRRSDWWLFLRGIKRQRRARKNGTQWPPDRRYGEFGWLPTKEFDYLFYRGPIASA